MEIVRAPEGPTQLRDSTFTGVVYADSMIKAPGVVVANVHFTPGARTFWHHHEQGQLLRVTSGLGLICSEGEKPYLLRPGDVVWVPPGERHWHGAGPDNMMQHMAVSLGRTVWFDEVTDEEYNAR